MGFLDLFIKRKGKSDKSMPKDVPLAKVEELVSKGLSMRQIVDYLKSEGYSIDLINKAFAQLKAKEGVLAKDGSAVSEPSLSPPPQAPPVSKLPSPAPPPLPEPVPDLSVPPGEGLPDESPVQSQPVDDLGNLDSLEPNVDEEIGRVGNVESLVEVIIEEKFSELVDKLESLDDLRESVTGSVDSFKSDLESVKERLDKLEKFRDESLSVQRKALDEFRLEISAMEKAFQKLVPNLSASLRKMKESGKKGSKKKED